MTVHHLRDKIPQLAARIEEGLLFTAEAADGTTVDVSRKRRWKTRATETVRDTEDAPTYIGNKLKKRGFSEPEVESWINRFAACRNGQELQLPTGETLIKNEGIVQLPKLTEPFVDDRVAVLIAFEFLALCLGESKLGAEFDAVRNYIRVGTKTDQVQVLNKGTRTRRYLARHTVRFRVKEKTLTVFVQFFEWCVFEVLFRNILVPSKEIVYIEDLENKRRLIALSPEDAMQGNWTVL